METVRSQEQLTRFERNRLHQIWEKKDQAEDLSRSGQFLQLFVRATVGIVRNPLTTGTAILTVAMTLFLFAFCISALENFQSVFTRSRGEQALYLYFKGDVPEKKSRSLQKELRSFPGIRSVRYQSADQALQEFKQELGNDAALVEGLEANPLPSSLEVYILPENQGSHIFQQIEETYENHALVDRVQYSQKSLLQLQRSLKTLRLGGGFGIVLLFLVTGFIISNAITLVLYSRREEISIMRLVGADKRFITAPYLLEGFLLGFSGSLLALGTLWLTYLAMQNGIQRISLFSGILPELRFLSPFGIGLLILSGIVVGVGGSYFACLRFYENPR